jgi:SOS response regulatory protein OraA/RecX
VQLLAVRPHFRRELGRKLATRGFPAEEIEAALDRLVGLRYLDDAKAAADFVAHRQGRNEGRHRLQAELQRRGADPEAIAQALADLPDDDLPQAREAARQWTARRSAGGKNAAAALARHLERRGFTRRAIFAVLTEAGAEPEDG